MEYEKKIIDVGNSLGLILPTDLCKYLELKKESNVVISDDNGKHGRFISIWVKK